MNDSHDDEGKGDSMTLALVLPRLYADCSSDLTFRFSITSGFSILCSSTAIESFSGPLTSNMVNVAVHSLGALFLAFLIKLSWSQQLQGPPAGLPYNVSASCLQALNTSVACPAALSDAASS